MKINKATAAGEAPHVKVGVYGASGVGKTRFGALAYTGDPSGVVVVCAERQAKAIIGLWNPDATVLEVESYTDIQRAYQWLLRGFRTGFVHDLVEKPGTADQWTQTSTPFHVETVVIDSASDIFRTLKAAVMAEEVGKARQRWRERKGSLDGFDAEDDLGQHGWDVLQKRFLDSMRAFRDLPCNLVALYALDEREDKVLGTVSKPYVQGRDLKSSIAGLYNAFAYAYRRPATGDELVKGLTVVREAAFSLDERFQTKGLDGLDAVEPLDFRRWITKFTDHGKKVAKKRDAALRAKTKADGPEPSQPLAEPQADSEQTITGQEPTTEATTSQQKEN